MDSVAGVLAGAQLLTSPAGVSPLAAARADGLQQLDFAALAPLIGAALRAVFADGMRTDVDFDRLTLRVNSVNRERETIRSPRNNYPRSSVSLSVV